MDEYMGIEELTSGTGYADVVFIPEKGAGRPVLLIELKWNKTADSAISQIRNRHYPQVLKELGGEVLPAGICYDVKNKKHTCKIEKMTDI